MRNAISPLPLSPKTICSVLAAFLMAGCVTNTVAELRADPVSYDGSIQVAGAPSLVFSYLREAAKNCLEQAPMGTPVISESEFESTAKTGHIRQRMTAQQVLLNMTIIDLSPLPDDETELKLYTIKGWRAIGVDMPKKEDLVRWANGDKVCWKGR
jgi:hypothetical protein